MSSSIKDRFFSYLVKLKNYRNARMLAIVERLIINKRSSLTMCLFCSLQAQVSRFRGTSCLVLSTWPAVSFEAAVMWTSHSVVWFDDLCRLAVVSSRSQESSSVSGAQITDSQDVYRNRFKDIPAVGFLHRYDIARAITDFPYLRSATLNSHITKIISDV